MWRKGVPKNKSNKSTYYWVYDDQYDLFFFCQIVDDQFIWFHADGVSKMVASQGPLIKKLMQMICGGIKYMNLVYQEE